MGKPLTTIVTIPQSGGFGNDLADSLLCYLLQKQEMDTTVLGSPTASPESSQIGIVAGCPLDLLRLVKTPDRAKLLSELFTVDLPPDTDAEYLTYKLHGKAVSLYSEDTDTGFVIHNNPSLTYDLAEFVAETRLKMQRSSGIVHRFGTARRAAR